MVWLVGAMRESAPRYDLNALSPSKSSLRVAFSRHSSPLKTPPPPTPPPPTPPPWKFPAGETVTGATGGGGARSGGRSARRRRRRRRAVSAVVGTYAPQWRGVACVQLAVAAMPLVVMKEGGEKWGGLEE